LSALELEITETTLLRDMDEAIRTLKQARDEGFSLSLDDFGTGYSSLSYLSRLPLNVLKLDRSFVAGLPGDGHAVAIVDAILEMAHQLGLRVVAEGVETVEGARFLAQRGCDAIQGFVFSRPLPAADLDRWRVDGAWKGLLA
jgi:EAL domain-containing protein (putative c-di-GMP-specific phosphodiesterase class I)